MNQKEKLMNRTLSDFFVALITPFTPDKKLDIEAFKSLITMQYQAGTHGVVVGGCTGESTTLNPHELRLLVEAAQSVAASLPLWVGVPSTSVGAIVKDLKDFAAMGAQGAMVTAPPMARPSQAHLYDFFQEIAIQSPLPIMLYDNPTRVGVHLTLPLLQRLASMDQIWGVKDASGSLISPMVQRLSFPPHFKILCGNDDIIAPYFAHGGQGWVSVVGNLFPRECLGLYQAWRQGDLPGFKELRDFLFPLSHALGEETNPGPIKAMMAQRGLCHSVWRAPVGPISTALLNNLCDLGHRPSPLDHQKPEQMARGMAGC